MTQPLTDTDAAVADAPIASAIDKPKRTRVRKASIPASQEVNHVSERSVADICRESPLPSTRMDVPVESDTKVSSSPRVLTQTPNNQVRSLRTPSMDGTQDTSTSNDSSYIALAETWNTQALQPFRVASLVFADKMYAIVERKNLEEHHELRDWFDDNRIGAVMRGEKIVSENEFWVQLFRQSISSLQQHFDGLAIRIMDSLPQGKYRIVWGRKPQKPMQLQGPASHQSGVEKTTSKKFFKKKSQYSR